MSNRRTLLQVADDWPKLLPPLRWVVSRWSRWRKPAKALPTPTGAYLAAAIVLLFPGTLKVIKGYGVTDGKIGALDVLRVVAPDVMLACVTAGGALLLLRLLRGRPRAALTFHSLTALYLLAVLMLSAIEHQAWARSASLLDWRMFAYTIEHYAELRPILAAEMTTAGVLVLVGAGVLSLLPAAADLLVARGLGRGLASRPRDGMLWLLGALPLLALAATPPGRAELFPLTQSASVSLLAGALEDVVEDGSKASARNFSPPDAARSHESIEKKLAAAGLTQNSDGKPKNVLLLVLESTRFDATSVHVPHLDTTPNLRDLAAHGLNVDRAYVDIPHTSKALVSILCGYTPRFSVEISESSPGGLPDPCLPHVFGHLGYRRAFFQSATGTYENRHQLAFNAGYEEVYTRESYDEAGFEETNYLSVEDKVMVDPIMRWVRQSKDKPFFITALTCTTHHAYGLPTDFDVKRYRRRPARLGARMPRPFKDYNRYLNAVRYSDEFLGELLDGLREEGVLDDTLIVVVGDHGQAFHEHGQKAHNTVIWEEGLHVPLVLYNERAIPTGRLIEGPRRQVDIAPTVLDLLGISRKQPLFEGRSLLDSPPHEAVYSSCWYDERCRAETRGDIRVVDHFENQPMEVFDLAADPFERRNLLEDTDPEVRTHWKAEAEAARKRMRAHAVEVNRRYTGEAEQHKDFLLSEPPKPAYSRRARLEDYVELIGYDAPTHEVVPDGFWEAVIYFKCLKPSPLGWRFFGRLETVDGRDFQVDHHAAEGQMYLHECKPGTIVADHVRVWIPGDFPPGELSYYWGSVYLKELGHVRRTNKRLARREVIPLERGVLVRGDSLLLAKLMVKPEYRADLAELRKRSILREPPKVEHPLNVRFGSNLVLVSASFDPPTARRLTSTRVTTVWKVEGEVEGPWQILVHLDSYRKGYWLRRAHTPVDGVHPIANWEPGTWVIDNYNLPVPPHMPRGDAKIWIGVRSETRRMRVQDAGAAEINDHRALAGTLQIER